MRYGKEARSLLYAVIDLFLLPFRRHHVEVLASDENTENGSRETICTGERETVW
jgi:hypothetical protein